MSKKYKSGDVLTAEDMNNIVTDVSTLSDRVDLIAHQTIPEEYLEKAVDEYVSEHSGGFATESEVKAVASNNDDIKILGWAVPQQMPLKNYTDTYRVFHQRSDRVCLADLDIQLYAYIDPQTLRVYNKFSCVISDSKASTDNIYCAKYLYDITNRGGEVGNKQFSRVANTKEFVFADYDYDTVEAFKANNTNTYIYYALAEEKQIATDGNEKYISVQNEVNSLAYGDNCGGKNLLNPTLATTTKNGITCTKNGDGTYTLNGTASAGTWFTLLDSKSVKKGTYKAIGCPSGGSANSYNMGVYGVQDIGNGCTVNISSDVSDFWVNIYVASGITMSNKVFKPMLTTDLNATYDSFVPYLPYSVKTLCNHNDDLKMLGYTVPPQMAIQNYTDSDGKFHQRVGRVDLGSLDWTRYSDGRCVALGQLTQAKTTENTITCYCGKYKAVNNIDWTTSKVANGCVAFIDGASTPVIYDTSYTTAEAFKNSLQGTYLYYELATEIVTSVDGNEKVESVVKDCFKKGNVYTSDFDLLSVPLGVHLVIGVTSKVPSGYGLLLSFNTGYDYKGYLFFSITDGTLHYCTYNGTTQKKAWTQLG